MDLIGLGRWALPLSLSILPGAACVLWANPATGKPARWGAILALSPPLAAGLIALFLLAGLPLTMAAPLVFGASLIASLTAWIFRVRRRPSVVAPDPPRTERAIFAFTALVCVVISLFPLLWEWWRISSDAWTHAAIVRSVAEQGVPPFDPGYAGLRLQYPWLYHALVAGLVAATGLDAFGLMAWFETVALAGVLLSASGLVRTGSPGRAVMALAVLAFGLNALFPFFLPLTLARAFFGEVRGWAEVARQLDLLPLEWDRTGEFLRSLGGQDFFLNKFMVATPFSLGLAAFTAALAAAQRHLESAGRGELVLVALAVLAAGLMHPVIGVHLVATLLVTIAAAWLLWRTDPLSRRLPALGLAVVAAAIPFALYFKGIAGGGGGAHRALPFDLAPLKLLGYASCLALGLGLAARPLVRGLRAGGPDRFWTLWILAGIGLAAVFRLPGPSPFFTVDKFAYLVWIPLAPLAGLELSRRLAGRSGLVRILVLVFLFVPVNGLALLSRAADPHTRVRLPWDEPGYVWARAHLPADAVLLTPAGDWDAGNFAARDQYYTLDQAAVQLGYPFEEIEARRRILRDVFAGRPLEEADRRRLAGLGRPVYVLWTDFNDPRWTMTPGAWARTPETTGPAPEGPFVFSDERIRIVELVPIAPRGPAGR